VLQEHSTGGLVELVGGVPVWTSTEVRILYKYVLARLGLRGNAMEPVTSWPAAKSAVIMAESVRNPDVTWFRDVIT